MPPKRSRLNDYPPQRTPSKIDLTDHDMEYATLEAREASFAPPTKRSKAGWPHKTPSPTDLAKAGFFYKPTSSRDNVECFMCSRQLDGWEEDDDALQEHLKHGSDCAWALLASIEQDTSFDTENMEDPTSEHMVEARRTTFESIGWPHEEKRGWTCKTQKMVEAGWHFAPTTECEDYVSCVYCKLSLDGWEPKDNPFDEHYRRSPECPFFVFAGTSAPSKRPKQKKGRASRGSRASNASRLSTQSNATLISQSESMLEVDQSIDNSAISIQSTASTATIKSKRKAPARAKTTKSKRAKTTKSKKKEPDSEIGTEQEQEPETQEPQVEGELAKVETIEEPSYPVLSEEPVVHSVSDAEVEQPIEEEFLPQTETTEIGLPEKDESPIPVKQISPLKEQTNPPRRTISSVWIEQEEEEEKEEQEVIVGGTVQEQSLATPSRKKTRSPSQPSDIENAPPSSRHESVRPPLSSPGAPAPVWTPIDVETIFKNDEEFNLFADAPNGQLSEQEKSMTVQEWIEHIASQAEQNLSQEAERVVSIFEREGQRALRVVESIVCV